ncbi:MAG: nuclear transport factor 2 family protein [Rhodospirillales bacterium]
MSDPAERHPVLEANQAFYKAFAQRDLATMENIWARRTAIACIHPGWPPIFGRDAVIASWRGILANPAQGAIMCSDERTMINGNTAVVICTESIAGSLLVATNVFVHEDNAWRLVHHQGGPMPAQGERGAKNPTPANGDKRTLH